MNPIEQAHLDFSQLAAEATERTLSSAEYWTALGKPVPTQFLGFSLPSFLRVGVDAVPNLMEIAHGRD